MNKRLYSGCIWLVSMIPYHHALATTDMLTVPSQCKRHTEVATRHPTHAPAHRPCPYAQTPRSACPHAADRPNTARSASSRPAFALSDCWVPDPTSTHTAPHCPMLRAASPSWAAVHAYRRPSPLSAWRWPLESRPSCPSRPRQSRARPRSKVGTPSRQTARSIRSGSRTQSNHVAPALDSGC
jgi:hypothetical protein